MLGQPSSLTHYVRAPPPIARLQANLTKAAGGPAMSEEQIRQAQDQIKRDGMPAFDPVSVPHTAVPPTHTAVGDLLTSLNIVASIPCSNLHLVFFATFLLLCSAHPQLAA
jgi:hypothetical protein